MDQRRAGSDEGYGVVKTIGLKKIIVMIGIVCGCDCVL